MTTEIFIRLPNGSYTTVQPEEAQFQKQLRGARNVLDCPRCGQSVQKTEDAPRWHVKADCQDETVKRALVEEWGRRSHERHG